ncbi:MAG: small multi-drug export protein [Proteobacteria bacterium]|nr:small multi-drug export protein [Pseudomonadota bacterium]MBU1387694.1 small multi-drug export protein [Pseudomonadota bacterium]MBU1543726.1 small multi-drug export protein [Pseudomonadota bacterium]MBU2482211.1 small multi-drug export protein [Pseudomonadota bacterium]
MKQKIFFTTEGRILLFGLFLSLLLLVLIGYFSVVDTEIAKTLTLTFFAHTFGGRAAGIGLCIIKGFGPAVTIGYNFYLEVLIVCFAYSIFVLSANNYIKAAWLTNFMDRLAKKADEQKEKVQSYGWIGLFLFVMMPLPVTGPVMGAIIGYMLKVNLVKNFTATGSGTLAAIIIWFYCFDFLEHRFHAIQYIFAAVIILALISRRKAIMKLIFGPQK